MVPPATLSVVIPSYNHARYVAQAVRSVLGQTFDDLELIVVDDGSTDDSAEVVRQAIAGEDRATLLEQTNAGAHAAIARGVEAARGRFISVLNSDDWYHPRRFEQVLPRLEPCGQWGIAFTGIEIVAESVPGPAAERTWREWYARAVSAVLDAPTVSFALMLQNFSVTSGNFLFTRALYDRLGGFCRHRFAHDWDFLLRACYYSEPVFVPEMLMSYRIHGANTTESVRPRLRQECTLSLNRYWQLVADAPPPNPLAPCLHNWRRLLPGWLASRGAYFDEPRMLSDVIAPHLRRAVLGDGADGGEGVA